MTPKQQKTSILITLCYWIPSCILMYDIIKGSGEFAFSLFGLIFFPGYFLGFLLGFGGGDLWVVIGQIISLGISYLFFSGLVIMISKRRDKKNTKTQQGL